MSNHLSRDDVIARLPRKRVAAGVLFFRGNGEVLLVNPTYKDHWEVPGGMAEVGESPRAAAAREIREELGVGTEVGRLLVLDWNPRGYLPDDGIMFLYLGGPLDDQQIHLANDELSEWCWCSRTGVLDRLLDFKARRVLAGMDAYAQNEFVELEDGHPVGSQALR